MVFNISEDLTRYCIERGCGKSPSIGSYFITLFSSPSFWAVVHHRFGFWINSFSGGYKNPIKFIFKSFYFVLKYFVVCFFKVEILSTSDIGPGIYLSNGGNIIIGVQKMGNGCTVSHNVTIGRGATADGLPIIGNHVEIGNDSLVFGFIRIGDNVKIGANTVLSRKIPDGLEVQGYPCKIVHHN